MSSNATQHVVRSAVLTLNAPPEVVFPLFGPVREAEWSPGWQPTLLYAASPLGEGKGTVFTTGHPDTVWIVAEWDPARRVVEYARVAPGDHAAQIRIECEPGPDAATTRARVTYTLTALTPAGSPTLDRFTEAHYRDAYMPHWQQAINARLAQL
jgi:hypothetical protein